MANIGATTAFYKVETSLTRANNEVSKSMERLATGKQNANAGDRSSYVAMSDTFRLDYVGTKAGIKGASVAMGYLETGLRVVDSASALLSRLQELAVLGANNTNTVADNEAINLEAEAIADEFNRLMTTSTYKGKDVFVTQADDQEIAMGGRGQEMSFGIGRINYDTLYNTTSRTIVGDPNASETFNLTHLPSDAVTAKSYGGAASEPDANAADITLAAGKKYVVRGVTSTSEVDLTSGDTDVSSASIGDAITASSLTVKTNTGTALTAASDDLSNTSVIDVSTATTVTQGTAAKEILTLNAATALNGEALAVDGPIATDVSRREGTYRLTVAEIKTGGTITSSGAVNANASAADAIFEVTVDDDGSASVVIIEGGSGFADDDIITVADADLGGGGGADLVFHINGVTAAANRVADEYILDSSQYTYSGTGTGATFSVAIDSSGGANVTVLNGGSGYTSSERITIDGSVFGASNASALTFTLNGIADDNAAVTYAEVRTDENAFQSGESYVIQSLGSSNATGNIALADSDALIIARAFTNEDGTQITSNLTVGQTITMATVGDTIGGSTVTQEQLDAANALIEGMTFTRPTETLTSKIETIQALLNRARVEAGSQYAAMESAVSYTTDLTAQYELGFNTVNDVNFSAETAHLAKNQILQQAATAMLAQANSGQQGLLQLIQG